MTAVAGPVPAVRPASRVSLGWLGVGVALVILATVLGLTIGAVDIPAKAVLTEVLSHVPLLHVHSGLDVREAAIVWDLRFPRVVLGLVVGAMLSVSGGAYQGVFRNPLADPYLLGAAAGAGFGATLALVNGASDGLVPVAAFVGAMVAVFLAYAVGAAGGRLGSAASLLLAGVAVASFVTALQTFVLQRNTDDIRKVYSWILGRLTTAGWGEVRMVLPYFVVTTIVLLGCRRQLDVLAVGDEEAASLGLNPERTRLLVVVVASLATAAAVSVSGLIGFVGIIVPHTVRLVAGHSYRVVLPLSVLFGAAFLTLADLVARTALGTGRAAHRRGDRLLRSAVLHPRPAHEPAVDPVSLDIVAKDVTVRYGSRAVLDQLELTVDGGEWVTIVGPNGGGKTTLLRVLAGLVRGQGRVELGGRATSELRRREWSRLVALVPQAPVVPPGLSVRDYVMLGRTPHLRPLAMEGPSDVAAARGRPRTARSGRHGRSLRVDAVGR